MSEKRKNIWLIDKENFGNGGKLSKIAEFMNENTVVYLFWTQYSNMVCMEIINAMSDKGVHIAAIECGCGTDNALDFQLVTELGRLIALDDSAKYFIVSNDNGYDAVIRYWRKRGIDIHRIDQRHNFVQQLKGLMGLGINTEKINSDAHFGDENKEDESELQLDSSERYKEYDALMESRIQAIIEEQADEIKKEMRQIAKGATNELIRKILDSVVFELKVKDTNHKIS